MNEDNPYLVGADINIVTSAEESAQPSTAAALAGWVVVFLINLPVPVYFGSGVVNGAGGFAGMAFGCTIWCGSGILLCRGNHARHVRASTFGGIFVALSQFYPMLQIFAGMCAIALANLFVATASGSGRNGIEVATDNLLADFVISSGLTVVTGAILIAVALTGGHLLSFLVNLIRGKR